MSGISSRSMRMWMAAGVGCAMIAAGALPSFLSAQNQPAAPAAAAAADNRPQAAMQAMSQAYRTLNGQIKDATKNASSLELLGKFETAALEAKGQVPPTIAALPEAERPAKLAAYKAEMLKLLRQCLDAEEALLANDNTKAGEIVTALAATQREGHTAFRGRGGARRGA